MTFTNITQTPVAAETKKWLRVRKKTQNPAGVDSGTVATSARHTAPACAFVLKLI